MRAVVVTDGNVEIESVPIPAPQAGQVRIKVHAASVNPTDWKLIARQAPGAHLIPGKDVSGIIDAVGAGAGRWKESDAVFAVATRGSHAEYAIAAPNAVAAKPPNISFDEAAGIPVAGETAWRALVTLANTQPGQRVLIHGGAGGVGSAAVQIAKAHGAYVIATASPNHDKVLHDLGADEIVDYHSVRFEEKVKNLDVVLNTVDDDTGTRSVSVLKPGGMLISIVGPPPAAQCEAAKIRCAVTGLATGEMLGSVSELAAQGKFHVYIDQTFPLEEAAKALDINRQGQTGGKIILEGQPLRCTFDTLDPTPVKSRRTVCSAWPARASSERSREASATARIPSTVFIPSLKFQFRSNSEFAASRWHYLQCRLKRPSRPSKPG